MPVTQLGRREEEINEEATVIQVGQTVIVQLIKCSSHTGNSGVTWTWDAAKSDDNIAEEVQAVRQLLKRKTRDDTHFQLETKYSEIQIPESDGRYQMKKNQYRMKH